VFDTGAVQPQVPRFGHYAKNELAKIAKGAAV
jgi:hypothetical protein